MESTVSEEPGQEATEPQKVPLELDGKSKLRKWLNMNLRIEMTDGRVLIGVFLCTDRDANVILVRISEVSGIIASKSGDRTCVVFVFDTESGHGRSGAGPVRRGGTLRVCSLVK